MKSFCMSAFACVTGHDLPIWQRPKKGCHPHAAFVLGHRESVGRKNCQKDDDGSCGTPGVEGGGGLETFGTEKPNTRVMSL